MHVQVLESEAGGGGIGVYGGVSCNCAWQRHRWLHTTAVHVKKCGGEPPNQPQSNRHTMHTAHAATTATAKANDGGQPMHAGPKPSPPPSSPLWTSIIPTRTLLLHLPSQDRHCLYQTPLLPRGPTQPSLLQRQLQAPPIKAPVTTLPATAVDAARHNCCSYCCCR